MKTLSADLTVGEIAAQSPASVRVFEKHKIDFCCGGKVPVAQACLTLGLDASQVLAELQQQLSESPETPGTDWQAAGLQSLIDHILTTHHAYMKTHLPRVQEMLDKVVSKHSVRHGETLLPLARIYTAMHEELDAHLMKEEMILFPLIRNLEEAKGAGRPPQPSHCGSVQNPLRVMLMEHDSAGQALVEMSRLTSGYAPPEDACNTYRALFFELEAMESDLHRHIHLENNILFPRAVELEGNC